MADQTVTLTNATTNPWTVPARCKKIKTTICGGGAGGAGGIYIGSGSEYGGYGGPASSVVVTSDINVTPATTKSYSIGSGGIGGYGQKTAGTFNKGGSGGTTTFDGASSGGGAEGVATVTATRVATAGSDGPISGGYGLSGGGLYGGSGGTGWGSGGGGGDGMNDGSGYAYNGGAGAAGAIYIEYTEIPISSFTKDASSGDAPLTVNFTNTSTDATSYLWHFGTGEGTSSSTSPSHQYTTPGVYSVTLDAINSGGTATSSAQTITVNAVAPVSSYTTSPTPATGFAPFYVEFTDTSTNSPNRWSWDFDDGSYATTQNPNHTFMSAGTFDVTLVAGNAVGDGSETYHTITATASPVAWFYINPRSFGAIASPPNWTLKFYDMSSVTGSSASTWHWYVTRTGSTPIIYESTLRNPDIEFGPTTATTFWTVKLEVSDTNNNSGSTTVDYAIIQQVNLP